MQFMQSAQFWVGLIAALVMAGGVYVVYYQVAKQNAQIGMQAVRFLGVVLVVPTLLILGLFGVVHAETIAAVIGVIVGYVLSLMGRE